MTDVQAVHLPRAEMFVGNGEQNRLSRSDLWHMNPDSHWYTVYTDVDAPSVAEWRCVATL